MCKKILKIEVAAGISGHCEFVASGQPLKYIFVKRKKNKYMETCEVAEK